MGDVLLRLDLIDFKPDEYKRDKAIKRAKREVMRYFGHAIDAADEDPVDDGETKRLREQSRVCV